MLKNTRLSEHHRLPKYWRKKKNSYTYRIPPHLQHLHDGKREISLGTSLGEAYKKFGEMYEKEECVTLMRELLDRYRMEIVPTHNIQVQALKNISLDRLRKSLGDNLVVGITPQDIYKYQDQVATKKSKKQANQDTEVLSHVFTKAIRWGVISDHPMTNKKVEKYSLPGRDRYVEDWELQEWAKVVNPFLVVYIVLKGVTGLRQQDLLTIRRQDISDTHLTSVNIKTGKKQRFPLYDVDGSPTTVRQALDTVKQYYASSNKKRAASVISPWLFHTRTGNTYYDPTKMKPASGFQSVWYRSMQKALKLTSLQESFTEHDLRAKVSSDIDSDIDAQKLLQHANVATTRKHYRRKGSITAGAQGFLVIPTNK
tara:strand:- start:2474 stop:3580 length:1107 start_codon:yes stop_codon:yes gene_type:complete